MILHYQDIPKSTISFHTKLKYSDNCSFIPISFKNNHAIQTPMMYIPYGIFTNENNKRFLDITFYNIENDTILRDFYNSLKKIFRIIQKKYKNIKVNSFLKNTSFGDSVRLKIDQNALFFNEAKQKIDSIKSNLYGQFLISLHGMWVINDEIWIQWILIQGKIKTPVYFNNLLIDENIKEPILNNKIKNNIPPPPPLPQFKKTDSKIKIIKKKKTEKKSEKHFEVPTIEVLQTILSNLKNVN